MKEKLLKSFSLPSPQKCTDHTMDPNKLNRFRGKCSHNSLTRSMLVGGSSPRLAMRPRQKVRSFVNWSIHFVWSCFSFGYDCLMLWFGKINLNIYIYICMCNYYIHLNKNACMCGWIYLSICLSILPLPGSHWCLRPAFFIRIYIYVYTYMYICICILQRYKYISSQSTLH